MQKQRLALLAAACVLCICTSESATASAPKNRTSFGPDFCEFRVVFPQEPTPRHITVVEPSTGVQISGESAQIKMNNYFLRAQCLYYPHCKLNALSVSDIISDMKQIFPRVAPNLTPSTYAVEPSADGMRGRAEGDALIAGYDVQVKSLFFWGSCSRMALTYATVKPSVPGIGEWIAFYESVRRKQGMNSGPYP